jgi:hypothetical protein
MYLAKPLHLCKYDGARSCMILFSAKQLDIYLIDFLLLSDLNCLILVENQVLTEL